MPPTNSKEPMAITAQHHCPSCKTTSCIFDFKHVPPQQLLYPPSPECVCCDPEGNSNQQKLKENKQSVPNDCRLAGFENHWDRFNVVSSFISTWFICRFWDHLQPLFAVSELAVSRFPWALDLAWSCDVFCRPGRSLCKYRCGPGDQPTLFQKKNDQTSTNKTISHTETHRNTTVVTSYLDLTASGAFFLEIWRSSCAKRSWSLHWAKRRGRK